MNPAPTSRTLRVQFLDTWHAGAGRAEGRFLDAVVDLDRYGLPYLSGRALKGLLRHAAENLVAWGHWPAERAANLFGSPNADESNTSRPGHLSVSSAVLEGIDREWLSGSSEEAVALRQAMFLEHFQTAIDPETGTAVEGSLRGLQVTVPLTLHAELSLDAEPGGLADGWLHIGQLLPLVRAAGAFKTRGHGRLALAWSDGSAA